MGTNNFWLRITNEGTCRAATVLGFCFNLFGGAVGGCFPLEITQVWTGGPFFRWVSLPGATPIAGSPQLAAGSVSNDGLRSGAVRCLSVIRAQDPSPTK